ncbi:MAG: hypothetical protein ACE5HR_00325 [bacterium]
MKVVTGIDLSWSGTGIVTGNNPEKPDFVTSIKMNQHNKKHAMSVFRESLSTETTNLYVIEGLGNYYKDSISVIPLAKLMGLLELFLEDTKAKIIYIAPTQLKKFITGDGTARKDKIMKDVYKRWGFDPKDSNEADAYGLFKIGHCLVNCVGELIKPQRDVLDNIHNKYKLIL